LLALGENPAAYPAANAWVISAGMLKA